MISLVLYGRNDTYGYNLHKRAAISLNCMAEVLTDPADEIIFVDYNTPDDFPTFPEAIQDTLTAKAKQLLRILRVRPSLHERFRSQTHLECLEPIARNVGIRRSNPRNRWILSTNTDMVFVPRRGKSLSEIAVTLPDAYYHSPRFEVPETLWESVDRMDPLATIESFGEWGRELHLNEIVYAFHPDVRYDGPGDFQLMLRHDLFRIRGFHESMLLGWHVDSNTARRLSLLPRPISDIVDDLYAYHCDHTRQVTPAHKSRGAQNDQKIYFENVRQSDIPEQAETWGLAGETIEEVPLDTGRAYLTALRAAIPTPLDEPTILAYSGDSFNYIDYPVEHVLPFLVDSISSYPRDTVLGWAGAKKGLLHGFARAWHELGFKNPILVTRQSRVLEQDLPAFCTPVSDDDLAARCAVCVFDWGRPQNDDSNTRWDFDHDPAIRDVMRSFRAVVRQERKRLSEGQPPPRRFIGINAINNAVEGIFNNHIAAALTPLATHIRQGFLNTILDSSARGADIVTLLYAGGAGQKLQSSFVTLPETGGYVFYGPYLDLDSLSYRLTVEFGDIRADAESAFLSLEVTSNSRLIAYREISRKDLAARRASLDFFISPEICDDPNWPRIEFRLGTPGNIELTVDKVILEETGLDHNLAALREFDCVPLLMVGQAGTREGRAIRARAGIADFVAYGPYFWLPSGHYEASFEFDVTKTAPGSGIRACVASHLGQHILGRRYISPTQTGPAQCSIEFDVSSDMPRLSEGLLEFLVHSGGRTEFTLTAVRVRYISASSAIALDKLDAPGRDVLSQLDAGHAGSHAPRSFVALQGAVGNVFAGNNIPASGPQRLTLEFGQGSYGEDGEESGLLIAAIGSGRILGHREITMDEVRRGYSAFDFANEGDAVTLRLRSTGLLEAEIVSAVLANTDAPSQVHNMDGVNLVKLLDVGKAGKWAVGASSTKSIIRSVLGVVDVLAYGPYIRLAPGEYDATFELFIEGGLSLRPITLDVSCDLGHRTLTRESIWPFRTGPTTRTLSFTVPEDGPHRETLYEFRVWAPGRVNFAVTGIFMEQRSLVGVT